ncbi:MAG TPA: peptide ABC transporter substrate-binding protein [Candidatus Sulfotelmatobacter sp.]|nr:peptide ABC transporter substrate-binding protein [Candidatus Sulfotelmatobacter sp.]
MKRSFAAIIIATALAGCTQSGSPGSTGTGQTGAGGEHLWTEPHVLRYANAEDVAGLNPHLVQQTTLGYMSSMTMAWLAKYDRDNKPVPELLTVIPTQQNGGISKDGKTITWHLRKGVKWSDGQPFSADDVVFSTNVVLNKANNEVSRDGWDLITKIDEPDKYTVVYHLRKPYASYLPTFFGSAGANPCILPKHLLGNLPNINNAPYNALPVGIGPFRYTKWTRGDSVEMEANPYYFRGMPKLKKVIFKVIPDRNTVLTQLTTHEIDLWPYVPASYYPRVQAIQGVATLREPSYYFSHLDFQNQHPVLADVRVREALRLAIDRDNIRQKLRHGLGILQETPVSPKNPAFDSHIPKVPFDLARANALLDQAGWRRGADGVRTKGGKRLVLDFATSAGTPDTDSMIELIRADWRKIGVAINVQHYPSSLMFAPMAEGGIVLKGKWDIIVFQWGGDTIGDLSNLYECNQIPPNGQNVVRYCNAQVDAAMEAFKGIYDPKARQKYADIVQEHIANDVPTVIMWIGEDIYGYNSDLKNFHPNQVSPFDDMMNVDI